MLETTEQDAFAPVPRRRRWVARVALAAIAACGVTVALAEEASAQEIQLTGPLAGAPAVRKMRLHREGRFEIAPSVSFTLLDEYQRTILPGLRLTYHPFDWFGVGVWGGAGFQLTTALTDEIQTKAINNRVCHLNNASTACRLTAANLTREGAGGATGDMAEDQLASLQWTVAPQLTFVPFRGKLALFSALFVDTDVHFFVGPAVVGVLERADCGKDDDGKTLTSCDNSFERTSRITVAPTFGLGLNFYPVDFFGFGAEWRGLPFSWNTSGFDNAGGGADEEFPDNAVNGADRTFTFNSMFTVNLMFQLPPSMPIGE